MTIIKREFDKKTRLDLLIHKEFKLMAREKNLRIKDLNMNILTNHITTKRIQKQ